MTTATAEALGDDSSNNVFAEMAFSIEKSYSNCEVKSS